MSNTAPHSHLPYGQMGSGHYGQWSSQQNIQIIANATDRILQLIADSMAERGDVSDSGVFTIGDYGTADGAVSFPVMRKIISLVRQKKGEIPIQIIYEDQPSNDFNSLFRRVHGLIADPPSYLQDFQKVFVMASGTSYYDQVMPNGAADIIMNFSSVHWLSAPAASFKEGILHFLGASPAEESKVSKQAAKDWETFLTMRARELKSGGLLILSIFSEEPDKTDSGIRYSYEGFFQKLTDVWKRFRDQGKISDEEFENTNIQCYARSLDKCKAPFEDEKSGVYQEGLRLVSADHVFTSCAFLAAWQQQLDTDGVDDRKAWAKSLVRLHRCWGNSSFLQGLSSTRSQTEKEALVDELYSRLEEELQAQDPRVFKHSILQCCLLARKL